MPRARDTRKVVTVPIIIRSDEVPDFSEESLWEIEDGLKGCTFCGHEDHKFMSCPNRLDPYQTEGGETRYS